jgi:hypothetical protein
MIECRGGQPILPQATMLLFHKLLLIKLLVKERIVPGRLLLPLLLKEAIQSHELPAPLLERKMHQLRHLSTVKNLCSTPLPSSVGS